VISQTKAERAAQLVEQVEERVTELKSILGRATSNEPTPNVGDRVLAEILERGASVTREELYAIAEKHGMDRRGLGGFFRVSGKMSLNELRGTDRIVLTPYGADQATRYLTSRPSIAYDDVTQPFTKAAEESFAEDWDSDEDSIYDRA
jgi:hypothetical protein